jgi:membrane-associated phospholipid phosphatase
MSSPPQMPAARFGARATLAGLALALLAVPFGLLLLLVQSKWHPLLSVDRGARDDLHRYAVHHDWFVHAMKAFSAAGSAPVYWLVFTILALWLVVCRRPRLAAFAIVAILGSALLNGLVKVAVDRARPVLPDPVAHANGMSFPSGHAQSAIVAYSVLLLVLHPRARPVRVAAVIAAGVMVVAIGFSRVALGVHYVSDVLAGYALGAAWVVAMAAAFDAWRRERAVT